MGPRRRLGTYIAPIIIPDSDDDEQRTVRGSAFIDLTQDDDIAQQFAARVQNSPTHSLFGPHSCSHPSQGLSPGQISAVDQACGIEAPKSAAGPSPQTETVQTDNKGATRVLHQTLSKCDTDSDISDVMAISRQRHLRGGSKRSSQNLDVAGPAIPITSDIVGRGSSSLPAALSPERSHQGPIASGEIVSSLSLSATEDVLQSIKREMAEDCAGYVNGQLQEAMKKSKELQANLPEFSDSINPFADMPVVDMTGSNTQVKDPTRIVNAQSTESTNEANHVPDRVPRYQHFITITRSFLVPDNRKLCFEPYLGRIAGDDEKATLRWLDRLGDVYDPPEDPQASRRRERVCRLINNIPKMLEKLELNREDVVSYMVETGVIVIGPPKTAVERFLIAFKKVFDIEVENVFPEYCESLDRLKKYRVTPKDPEEDDPIKHCLQPHLLSCPVCYVYLCGIHGVYESSDSEDEEPDVVDKAEERYADMNITYEGLVRGQKSRTAQSGGTDPIYCGKACGSNCFTINMWETIGTPEWTTDEITYFQALHIGMQNEARAACILAPLMRRSCCDVQWLIISLSGDISKIADESRECERLDWYDNQEKTIQIELDWGKKTKTHLHHDNLQPEGCEHPGFSCYEAKDDCSCNRKEILCDKFCACPDDCYMKFTGCNCSQWDSTCSQESLTCPCNLLNRECDPDLCKNCGARESANPFHRDQSPPPGSCCNTDIQRGVRKRLLVGESSHPGDIGFGAYMAEPVKQGEFIAEYVGEIITEAEAMRRHEIYDKLKVSFIFDLNQEVLIDSYRYGNTERFINHSRKHANCKPLVKLVNGEHRIGFFAMKDLVPGEELFFDYGKKFTAMHGLKEMDDVGTSKMKEVASRKTTLALKGMKDASNEILDGSNGIETLPCEEEEDVNMAEADSPLSSNNEVDEYKEDVDHGKPSKRPRRSVAKPKKYTR